MLRCVEGEDKLSACKSKVMVLNKEEGLGCEVHIDGIHLQLKTLGSALSELSTDGAEFSRKVVSERKVEGGKCH